MGENGFLERFFFHSFDFGEENAFAEEAFLLEITVKFFLKQGFDLGAGRFNLVDVQVGKSSADTRAGNGADDFTDEVFADVLPKLGGVSFVNAKED